VSHSSGKEIPAHHVAWLSAHPHRSRRWFSERLADGFDVHHLDNDHENNAPDNLVLIEHTDHMALHGGRGLGRLGSLSTKGKKYKTKRSLAYSAAKRRADELRVQVNMHLQSKE
jgi:hypothetical protein